MRTLLALVVLLAALHSARADVPQFFYNSAPVLPENQLTDQQKQNILAEWVLSEYRNAQAPFCWMQGYGRGLGQVPGLCPPGNEKQNNLCYPACRPGYKGNGPVCWSACPAGYAEDLMTCRRAPYAYSKPAPYGRGAGYVLTDPARCQRENPQGCEQNGLLLYPKCSAGFHAVGCCVCSPDCEAGFRDDGATCFRDADIFGRQSYGRGAGIPLSPGGCGPGAENQAGLCYPTCRDGYTGSMTTCTQGCPAAQKVSCAAGCAVDQDTCDQVTDDQVHATLTFFWNLVQVPLGGDWESGATSILEAMEKGGAAVAKQVAKNVVSVVAGNVKDAIKGTVKTVFKIGGRDAVEAISDLAAQRAVMARMSKDQAYKDVWSVILAMDPTGIGAVVDAFTKPQCSGPTEPPKFAHLYDKVLAGAYGAQRGSIEALVDRGKTYNFIYLTGAGWNSDAATFRGTTLGGTAGMTFNPRHNHVDVFSRDADGALHFYSVPSGAWQEKLPVPGLKVAFGSPMVALNLGGRWAESEVWFKAADGRLSNVIWDSATWLDARRYMPGTETPVAVTNALAAVVADGFAQAFWYGTDDRVHRVFVQGGAWQHELVGTPMMNGRGSMDYLGGLPLYTMAGGDRTIQPDRTNAIAAVNQPGRGVTVFVSTRGQQQFGSGVGHLMSMTRTPGGWQYDEPGAGEYAGAGRWPATLPRCSHR